MADGMTLTHTATHPHTNQTKLDLFCVRPFAQLAKCPLGGRWQGCRSVISHKSNDKQDGDARVNLK